MTMLEPDIETMPRDELAQLQLSRLKASVARAYDHVPYYRASFDGAGIDPRAVESLDALKAFPFVVKDVLRDNYPFGLFAVPREKVIRVHVSSGTTGKPTVVGYTARDLETWSGLMARAMAAAGLGPGDIVHNALGYGLFTGGLGFHDGAQRLECTVIPISGGLTERQILLLQDFKARGIFATPSYALNIADSAAAAGVDLASGALEIGIFGAEPWSNEMRRELETRLGIKAYDHYGLSEIMGPGVAAECDRQDGLHGWEDQFIFEVIDPESGERLPAGERGELVITTLTKEALPMVRYRTRDLTVLTDEPCPCGRTHLRIQRVTGRDDDMLIIRGVNLFPSQIESVLLQFPGIAPHYQLVLRRQGALDALTVEVEASPDVAAGGKEAMTDVGRDVAHHVKSLLGVTCAVQVKGPGEVPRSEGKAVRVRDLRN